MLVLDLSFVLQNDDRQTEFVKFRHLMLIIFLCFIHIKESMIILIKHLELKL